MVVIYFYSTVSLLSSSFAVTLSQASCKTRRSGNPLKALKVHSLGICLVSFFLKML